MTRSVSKRGPVSRARRPARGPATLSSGRVAESARRSGGRLGTRLTAGAARASSESSARACAGGAHASSPCPSRFCPGPHPGLEEALGVLDATSAMTNRSLPSWRTTRPTRVTSPERAGRIGVELDRDLWPGLGAPASASGTATSAVTSRCRRRRRARRRCARSWPTRSSRRGVTTTPATGAPSRVHTRGSPRRGDPRRALVARRERLGHRAAVARRAGAREFALRDVVGRVAPARARPIVVVLERGDRRRRPSRSRPRGAGPRDRRRRRRPSRRRGGRAGRAPARDAERHGTTKSTTSAAGGREGPARRRCVRDRGELAASRGAASGSRRAAPAGRAARCAPRPSPG